MTSAGSNGFDQKGDENKSGWSISRARSYLSQIRVSVPAWMLDRMVVLKECWELCLAFVMAETSQSLATFLGFLHGKNVPELAGDGAVLSRLCPASIPFQKSQTGDYRS